VPSKYASECTSHCNAAVAHRLDQLRHVSCCRRDIDVGNRTTHDVDRRVGMHVCVCTLLVVSHAAHVARACAAAAAAIRDVTCVAVGGAVATAITVGGAGAATAISSAFSTPSAFSTSS